MIGWRPKRSASIPKPMPPTVPPIRKNGSKRSPQRRTSGDLLGTCNSSASRSARVMLKSCPSNASNTQPADAITSTSHW